MKQLPSIQFDMKPINEFDQIDSYYSAGSDLIYMDVITTLIEDISYPVFIVKNGSRRVYTLNEAAREGIDASIAIDKEIDEILQLNERVIENQPTVFFNNQWYLMSSDSFTAGSEVYDKVELKAHSSVPDATTLDRWKHMIAVMLHRFRSPLTGISGYLDLLMTETKDDNTISRALKVDEGVNHLADIMDELEYFYHIPSKFDISKLEPVELTTVLNRVLLDIPEELRNRVQFMKPTDAEPFSASKDSLEKVLWILLSNALAYSNEGSPVTVSQLSNKSIRISNEGAPIAEEIREHLFHPFVTSKANNLGIGLTMALLYASQFGGTIFQTENGESGRISFTICFP
jgi:signal transduction histidine kinase